MSTKWPRGALSRPREHAGAVKMLRRSLPTKQKKADKVVEKEDKTEKTPPAATEASRRFTQERLN